MKKICRQVITAVLVALLVCPVTSLRVREDDDADVIYGTKARVSSSVRRRLKASRQNRPVPTAPQYEQDYASPSPTPNYVEHKTDFVSSRPINKPDPDVYPINITPSPFASHPKTVRASSIQVKTPSSLGEGDYTPKPFVKIKTGRRRKVKRPQKNKPLVSNVVEEDYGGVNSVNNEQKTTVNEIAKDKDNATASGGDKNLAVEIGQEDGKYALIDKFFDKPLPQAPGVLSYAPSEDFAHDNKNTLGNLKANDIWLSDGHLLVLKGGDLDTSTKEHWKPIDNYERNPYKPPLKIPVDTSNPPPFPVFVNSSGPPVFLGPPPPFGLPYPPPGLEGNGTFDPSRLPPPGLIPLYPNGSIPPEFLGPPIGVGGYDGGPGVGGYPGGVGPGGYPVGGNGSLPFFPPFPGQLPPGAGGINGSYPPLPPFGFNLPPGAGAFNGSLPPLPFLPPYGGGSRNGSFPPILPPPPGFNGNFSGGPPPGFPLLPPLVLNPNDNETDDPSIFLPPPYDFDYEDGDKSLVPPGPFAPGLVVPPPKDFYTTYNKTKRFPSVTAGLPYGKRPQRPNGRKPKFPITQPPDDSLEALLPHTSPSPYLQPSPSPYPQPSPSPYPQLSPVQITTHSKKRKRPSKTNKGLFSGTLPKLDSSQEIAGLPPSSVPISEQVVTSSPLITTPQPHVAQPVIIKNSTPKPHNNYVYVRGQLKTLAEIAAEQAAQQQHEGHGDYDYPTPRPPYDERGYPTRVLDDNEPTLVDYAKKTTKAPAKTAYFNTPKYDNLYNVLPKRIKLKNRLNYQGPGNSVTPTVAVPQNPHPSQNPALYSHHQHPLFPGILGDPATAVQLQGQLHQQHQQDVYDPHYQEKITHNYYGNQGVTQIQPLQRPKQIVQLQSPKDYVGSQRQPHSYDQGSISPASNAAGPGVGGGNTGFRPAFGPNQRPSQGTGAGGNNRLLYPGQVTQIGPIFNLQSPIFQQQKQSHRPQGYYSPITQYHQPINQQQNNYYHPQHGLTSSAGLGQSGLGQNQYNYPQQHQVYEGEQQYQQQIPQHYRNFGQGSIATSPQLSSNPYAAQLNAYNPPQTQTSALHQDALISYR